MEQTDEELAMIMAHDTDAFNKWDAGNRLATALILGLTELPSVAAIEAAPMPAHFVNAIRAVLTSCTASSGSKTDASLVAYALQLPDVGTLAQEMKVIDPERLKAARGHVKKQLSKALRGELEAVYDMTAATGTYQFTPAEVGRRRLRNTVLDYLGADKDAPAAQRAKKQFDSADCMTDKVSY